MTPEGWNETSVRDLLDAITTGVSVNSESRPRGPGEVGVLKTSAVTYGVFRPHENKVVISGELHRARENPIAGCVLLSRMNTPALVGASAYVDRDWPDLVLPDRLWQLRPKRDCVDARWLFHFLSAPESRSRLSELASGTSGSMKNLSQEKFFTLSLGLPPLGEQRKIAAILSSVDDAIEATQVVIDQLQVVKKAMMAELLTRGLPGRHTRFKMTEIGEVPEEWEVVRVADCCTIRNDLRKPISESERARMPGPYPYYGPTRPMGGIGEYRLDGTFALIGEDGDHFLKFDRWSMTQLVSGRFNVNNHAHVVSGTKRCSAAWFATYFQHRDLTAKLTRQGANRYKLRKATLEDLPIALPRYEEQDRINALLACLDARAREERSDLAGLSFVRSALMSVLLTGEVRVKPDEEAV